MQKNPFIKAYWIRDYFEVEYDWLALGKMGALVVKRLIFKNYGDDYFHIKISLKFLVKSLVHSAFSLTTCDTKP